MGKMMNKGMYSSASDHWATPREVYDALDFEFNFNYDPCPLHADGGLDNSWGTCNFVNPPYSKIKDWIKKGYEVSQGGQPLYFSSQAEQILDGGMNML